MNESEKATQLNAAFDKTGVVFHDRAAAIAAFQESHPIDYNEDGQPLTTYDAEDGLPLSDALTRFAYDRREFVDGRTLPRQGAGSARPGILSKAGLTTQEKVAFISEHGADAFARLPTTGIGTAEVRTRQDWFKLPRAEKVRRLAADPDALVKLPNDPAQARIAGAFINTALLEKQRRIRPASPR